jgi:hypothetical protein
MRPDYSL